jgi:arginine deiminase
MRKTYYRGTPDQAMAIANDISKQWDDAKRKAKHTTLEESMQDLVNYVSTLEDLINNGTKSSLLDAEFEFAYIQEALDIVRFSVGRERQKLES